MYIANYNKFVPCTKLIEISEGVYAAVHLYSVLITLLIFSHWPSVLLILHSCFTLVYRSNNTFISSTLVYFISFTLVYRTDDTFINFTSTVQTDYSTNSTTDGLLGDFFSFSPSTVRCFLVHLPPTLLETKTATLLIRFRGS